MLRGSSIGTDRSRPLRYLRREPSDSEKRPELDSTSAKVTDESIPNGDNKNGKPLPVVGTTVVSSTASVTLGNMNKNGGNVTGSNTSVSSSSDRSAYPSRYVPLGERSGMSNLLGLDKDKDNKLNAKREAFFKNDPVAAPKFDPSLLKDRERDKDREREKEKSTVHHAVSNDRPEKSVSLSSHKPSKEVDGYVGFANLPNQVYRKSVKKGFEFTLMVVGESGLGKSTLINTLFLTGLYNAEYPGPSHRIKKTVQVETTQVVLKEGGVQLRLTIVDTPGFGDAVDNSNCWQPITDFIESRYDEYLNSESRVNRRTQPDTRVHCCLYFLSPNGHGLKPLDVEFMKRLHDKVNIIPLIAKADTMTPDECRDFKKTILNEIAQHKIKIYEFPECDDEEEKKTQKKLKDRVPFSVIGSNTVIDSNGKKVRGRVYPWGTVEVENLEHNDFIALRNMLIRTHMQDLKFVTNNVHYESFRYNRLATVTGSDGNKAKVATSKNPIAQMEEEKKEHVSKMKKMEAEMEQVFEMKVKEKKQKLKDSETDLQRRAEQMKKSLEQQQKEIEEKYKQFEREREEWEETQKQLEERRRSLENSKEHMDKDKKKDKKKSLF